jgi:NAD(P)-dependent dehydrogenase (short-subunit alcohol dehydrogenase family)
VETRSGYEGELVARALIVGCGCRGRAVGKRLLAGGWQVRGTSRHAEGLAAIEEAGIEPALADPADPGSVLDLVGDVGVVAWLLGSAEGSGEELSAIHGPRLDRVLERLVETPVRGFVYDAGGSVDPILLARGKEAVEAASETWEMPASCLLVDPHDDATWDDPLGVWTDAATQAVVSLLK